ncbi:hypothetical protein [Pseudemcibacter aquimaris]|uniref:hypothetical protein n=1 Tax=Pseudemcibacter aquimaris TaxID=2857064 RepID=UPI00201332EE|nr:hypothetical protein [Pseudemcibacter aquimaris]MCC3860907.1 hypothetical protein [Pseudemcibacter aquimaris]WDU59726.1 hypothetical protein KW060_05585 [Pseudemcibacter aquimaris]
MSVGKETNLLKKNNNFSFEKYYLDMVTSEGQYIIGYAAKLKYGSFTLGYASTIHHADIDGINQGPVLYSSEMPIIQDDSIYWKNCKLGIDGKWNQKSESFQHTLLDNSSGSVQWECLQNKAEVTIKTNSGKSYEGLGYSEFLKMTLKPWEIGLKILYWGRYVSETNSIVWIEWQGKKPLILLNFNGQIMTGAKISDQLIECDEFSLALKQKEIIRSGNLGNTVLSKIPPVLRVAPLEMLNVIEEKYLSQGTLDLNGNYQDIGWVIHEKVTWP